MERARLEGCIVRWGGEKEWGRESGGPEEDSAREFISYRVGVYCGQGSGRGPAIVEEAKDINGMQTLAEREKEEDIVWYTPASIVYQGSYVLREEIEGGVNGLDSGE